MVYLYAMTVAGAATLFISAVNISVSGELVADDAILSFSAPDVRSSCVAGSFLDSSLTLPGSEAAPTEIDVDDNCNTISGSIGATLIMSDLKLTSLGDVITKSEHQETIFRILKCWIESNNK